MCEPMRDITNIDLFCVVKELKFLEGARLKKIYQYGPTEFRLRFSPREGVTDIAVILPKSIHITKIAKEAGEPPAFVMLLRKHLEGKILKSVEQPNLDRIVVFDFSSVKLVIEMMWKGNLILTDENGKIIAPLRGEETKKRTIRRGELYVLPEMTKIQPFEADNLEEKPLPGEKVVEYIGRVINLPPFYAKEICARAQMPLNKIAEEGDIPAIIKHTKEFWKNIQSSLPSLYEGGDFSVAEMHQRKGIPLKSFSSVSELLDKLSSEHTTEESKQAQERVKSGAMEKIQRKLEHQQTHHKELLRQADEMKATGDIILKNHQFVNETIETTNSLRKSGKEWEEIERELNRLGKKIKLEKGRIVIEW